MTRPEVQGETEAEAEAKKVLARVLPLDDAGELARRIVMAEVLGPPPGRRRRHG